MVGTAINVAFRLLEAGDLKQALANSPGLVALIASGWFFDEVIRHTLASHPETYRQVRVVVKETDESAWIRLPDSPYFFAADQASSDLAPSADVPRQLPAAISCFAGRDVELQRLTALLDGNSNPADTMVISAIDGMPGIGKTALAVYWARQVASRYPDGQLYMNLRGFDPRGVPVSAAQAVRGFLDALGIPAEQIPQSLDAQASLYRSRLAGRRMLVLLDNASDVEQVRPLLPGSPGCLVLITSRNQLTGLIAEGAHPLPLDLPTGAEAHQLLERRLGAHRLAAEPASARQMIELCGRLPLALSIVAARAVTHQNFSLTDLTAELRSSAEPLDAIEGGDPAANARAVFSWSYQQLSTAAASMFRSLGAHPGPNIAVAAAASTAGIPITEARSALAELARSNLITEHVAGRFAIHDLLRAYAMERSAEHEHDDDRRAAVHRVLDYYLHTAMAASQRFNPGRLPLQLADPQPGVVPVNVADKEQALAWFDAEVRALLALTSYADTNGFDTHAWQIPWALAPYFNRRGRSRDYIATQQIALAAGRRLDDTSAIAHAHYLLAHAQANTYDYEAADPNVRQALDMFRELGDRANEAVALNGLSAMLEKQERYPEALDIALEALRITRAIGHWWTQAYLENGVGWLYAHMNQFDQALTHCQRSLSLHRESGNRGGTADTLDSLGYIYQHLGDLAQAKSRYEQAIDIYREMGAPFGEGNSLAGLGEATLAAGQLHTAHHIWQQAVTILRDIPSYDTTQLELRLSELETRLADPASPPD